MTAEIILIGPPTTGKTTAGRLLAAKLPSIYRSLDDQRWRYMKEVG